MNGLSIKLRSIARKAGLHHWIWRMRTRLQRNRNYEESCSRALRETVREGDVVWDVGANVGFYTELFCKWAGPEGHVVAIEPDPEAISQIEGRLKDCRWLSLENVALGSRDEMSVLVITGVSRMGHVGYDAATDPQGQSQIPIHVTTGDSVCARLGRAPNVLKIDVEGLEEEVLQGLDHTLSSPTLRALLIEVHFQQLESRGQPTAPIRIEKLLKSKGFRLKWIDRNHLQATRPE